MKIERKWIIPCDEENAWHHIDTSWALNALSADHKNAADTLKMGIVLKTELAKYRMVKED